MRLQTQPAQAKVASNASPPGSRGCPVPTPWHSLFPPLCINACSPLQPLPRRHARNPQAPAALLGANPVHRPPGDWACPEPRSQLLITHFSTLGWSLHALTHVAPKAVLQIAQQRVTRKGGRFSGPLRRAPWQKQKNAATPIRGTPRVALNTECGRLWIQLWMMRV